MTKQSPFPIIFLWCHPRSMSTAVERIMRERGDFKCFHEPFMYDYYIHRKVANMPYFDIDPAQPMKYDDIKNMLLDQAQHSPLFVKDMSYYIIPQIFEDEAFAAQIKHSFLIRNPMHSILSYFKLDQNMSLEEIGIEAQYKHVTWLKNTLNINPVILDAERIRENTYEIITKYWHKLGIETNESAFHWNKQDTPQDWQQVSNWHGSVSQSGGIRKPNQCGEENRQKEFDSLSTKHPKLAHFLEHHQPFYDQLKLQAIT